LECGSPMPLSSLRTAVAFPFIGLLPLFWEVSAHGPGNCFI
jgi:hypothetical protein